MISDRFRISQSDRKGARVLFGRTADVLTAVAGLCLAGMIGLIVVDTVFGNLVGTRIFGAYEIVGLLMAPVAFLPIARTLLKGGHLTVEIVDSILSAKAVHLLRILGLAGMAAFACMLSVFMYRPLIEAMTYGEVTPDLGIPVAVKLAPIFLAICAAAACAAFLLIVEVQAVLPRRGK